MVDFLLMQSAQKSRLMFFLFAYLGTHTLDTELCKLIRKKKKKHFEKRSAIRQDPATDSVSHLYKVVRVWLSKAYE